MIAVRNGRFIGYSLKVGDSASASIDGQPLTASRGWIVGIAQHPVSNRLERSGNAQRNYDIRD
jgi:hypothetical protein